LERLISALSFLLSGEEMSDGGVSRFVTSSDVSHFRYHVVYRVSISNKNFGDSPQIDKQASLNLSAGGFLFDGHLFRRGCVPM